MASSIREFAHLKIPLEEIEKATNNFDEKNIIGRGGFGNVYRGELMRSGEWIKFSARRLDRKYGQGDIEFLTEISMLSCLEHENLVSMIGFCDEKGEKVIVNKYYAKGSLSMHLSKPTLTWIQRVDIALGIARAIEYIHDKVGQSYYVIHRNINSSTILLDEKLIPKLSGFEFSIKHPVDLKNQVFVSQTIGTYGYIDPEIYKTGGVTHKSDIYSFGVVLCEIVCGSKIDDVTPLATHNNGKMSLREIIDKELLSDLIHKDYGCELYLGTISKFASTADDCLLTDRSRRSDAIDVVSTLNVICEYLHKYDIKAVDRVVRDIKEETSTYCEDVIMFYYVHFMRFLLNPSAYIPILRADDNLQLTIRERLLRGAVQSGSSHTRKVNILEHLRIPLKDIQLATNNFSEESIFTFTSETPHCLRLRHLGICYTAELECLDREYMFSMDGKNIHELPKRRYKVWILRIGKRDDIFNKQIEILGRCKHPNIESLLGFCDEGCVRILVYEFTNKEALNSHIYSPLVTWERCLKICLNVARGLNYLQIENADQKPVIHGNITNDNIDAYINGDAKLVDFTYSQFLNTYINQDDDALHHVAVYYTDPEYLKSGKLTRESDVYSFGVVMYEIFCGSFIRDSMSSVGHADERSMQLVCCSYEYGTIKKDLASKFKEENYGNKSFLPKGPNKDSLDTFLEIMYMCLAKTQNQRPQMEVVLKELEKALSFQENHKDPFRMSFEDIKSATNSFSSSNKIGEGGFGTVYKGELTHKHGNGNYNIVAKLDKSPGQGEGEKLYYNELQILYKYMHENIIRLLGYSNETDVRLIVYEQASKGSLERYLNDVSLTWRNRLNICIDIATGLDFLHGGIGGQSVVIHRDLKSANILLFDDWKAKLGDFGLSLITTIDKETNFIIEHPCGTMYYVDPVYLNSRILTVESDMYSFGVLLFEILYGRETYNISKSKSESLLNYIKRNFEEGKQEEIVFEAIKKEIMPKSLTTFQDIVQSCLAHDKEKRPTSKEVLSQLKKALEFQNEEA